MTVIIHVVTRFTPDKTSAVLVLHRRTEGGDRVGFFLTNAWMTTRVQQYIWIAGWIKLCDICRRDIVFSVHRLGVS